MHSRTLAAAVGGLLAASTLWAQKEPKRPKLPVGADTNNAAVYYQFALEQLRHDPEKSADALYWATRIDPTSADAFYARRIAMLLSDPRRLLNYWSGDRRTIQSDEVKRIDSLFYHAMTLNPFVSQTLDRQLFEGVADEIASRYERSGGASSSEVRYYIDNQMSKAGPATKAWLAYGDGRYDDAIQFYTIAIKGDKRNEVLRLDLARVFYQMGKVDSALAELTLGIEDLRKRDKKDLIYVYQSKALTEQSIGVAQLRLGNTDAAREAFGRALQEDLAYSPAHFQLAYLLLEAKDTTGALNEMDLAVQAKGDDPMTQYIYGYMLAAANKLSDAETHLRKAIDLDKVYATPHLALGSVLERTGKNADASTEFTTFVALAAKTDPRIGEAQQHLQALASSNKPN